MSKAVQKMNTPLGTLEWVFITGDGKEDLNGNARYTASVYMTKEELEPFQKAVDAFWEENKPKGARKAKSNGIYIELKEKNGTRITTKAITQPYDAEEWEPTGRYAIQAWSGVYFPNGDKKKVPTYNARGAEVSLGNKSIGNGSKGRLAVGVSIYSQGPGSVGVTIFLNGVQLTKFVEYAAGVGFDAIDGDFDEIETEFDGLSSDDNTSGEEPRVSL